MSFSILTGCVNQNKFSEDQKNVEKEKLKSRIQSFFLAYENKNMDEIISMLSSSDDFFYFGSDVSEIGGSKAKFQNQMDMDWKLFNKVKFGEIKNNSIFISDDGSFASSMLEIPFNVVISDNPSSFIFRVSLTFTNESGVWRIVQALFSVPSVGQSSVELVQKKYNKN